MMRFRRRWPAPEDAPWREAELAVVDLELTGLDQRVDEIISIGVTPVRAGGSPPTATTGPSARSRPSGRTPPRSTRSPSTSSPRHLRCRSCSDQFREQLRGKVLVAHAAFVERAFLDRAFADVGERLPRDILDTAPLARAAGLAKVGQGVPTRRSRASSGSPSTPPITRSVTR